MQRKYSPSTPVKQVARTGVIQKHLATSEANFTVIVGPAGYGKSTLAEQWIKSSKHPYGWLNLDNNDDNSRKFWSNIVYAFTSLAPELERQAKSLLSHVLEPAYIDFVDWLIEVIERQGRKWDRPMKYFLVIDNFSSINNAETLKEFNRFVDYVPHWVHVVILCQKEPRVNLVDRFSKGSVEVIGNEQLSFSLEETQSLIQMLLDSPIPESDARNIHVKTNGWPSLVHILCLSLRAGLVLDQALSPEQANLSGFLLEKIFNHLTPEEKHMCYVLSIPSKFDKKLVKVLFDDSGMLVLDLFTLKHAIATRLEDKSDFFQFNPLLRDWLHSNNDSFIAEPALDNLADKMIAFFYRNNDFEEAICLAVRFERWPDAVDMTEKHYPNIIESLDEVLAYYPVHIIDNHPFLLMVKALRLFGLFQYKQVQRVLNKLNHILADSSVGEFQCHQKMLFRIKLGVTFLESHMLRLSADTESASVSTRRLLESLDETDSAIRCWCHCGLMIDAFMDDHISLAADHGFKAVSLAKETMELSCFIASLGWLLPALALSGRIPLAIKMAETNIAWIRENGFHSLPDMLFVEAQLVELYREKYDLDAAWQLFELLQKRFASKTDPRNIIYAKYNVQIDLLVTSGQLHVVEGLIDELEAEVLGNYESTDFIGFFDIDVMRAMLALKRNRKQPLIDWYKHRNLSAETTQHHRNNLDLLACLAELLLKIDCEKKLISVLNTALTNGVVWRAVKAEILLSMLYQAKGEKTKAKDCFGQALQRAKTAGYYSVFAEDVKALGSMLKLFKHDVELGEYSQAILNASSKQKRHKSPVKEKQVNKGFQVVEDLTSRELEVLQLAGEGLSNQHIADRVFISVSTVKNHLSNIFAKLNVKSRTEAVSVARTNNLI